MRVELGDLAGEGRSRSNAAIGLIKLRRYDEARGELERALDCSKSLGHAAERWKTSDILCDLEHAVGNELAALVARQQAMGAYLAYRRDGGAPQIDPAPWATKVKQDPVAARAFVDNLEVNYLVAAEIVLALERQSESAAGTEAS